MPFAYTILSVPHRYKGEELFPGQKCVRVCGFRQGLVRVMTLAAFSKNTAIVTGTPCSFWEARGDTGPSSKARGDVAD